MVWFLSCHFVMITQHIPLWVGCGCLGDLYCYLFCVFFKDCSQLDLLERLCTTSWLVLAVLMIHFYVKLTFWAVPIFQMSNHYDSVIKVGHRANGMIHDHNSCIWLTMCSCQFADLTDLHVLVKYFPNSRLGFLYRYQGSVTVRYC